MRKSKVQDSDDSENEGDLLQQLYEGGQAGNNDRINDKYGEEANNFSVSNSGIRDGLVNDRGCTDIACLIVFMAFIASLGYLTYYGNANGHVSRLIAPLDGDKKFCGDDEGYKSHKYLYLTNFEPSNMLSLFDSGVCVNSCPSSSTDQAAVDSCQNTQKVTDCKTSKVRKTYKMLNYCIPDFRDTTSFTPEVKKQWNAIWQEFMSSSSGSYVNDLYLASTAIWVSIAMAPIYCFIFIAIMSAFAEVIAWICVGLVQIGLIAGAVLCYMYRSSLTVAYGKQLTAIGKPEENAFEIAQLTKSYSKMQSYLLYGIIGFSLIAAIFLCCIIVGFKSLKLAIDVIDASADFLNKTKRVILVPIFYFFVTLLVVFLWLASFICVISMNKIKASDKISQGKWITWTSEANQYLAYYMIFSIIWVISFIQYKSQFIVQVSAASYYFSSNSSTDGSAEVGKGFKFAYLNHIGSLAMGSFIIGTIRFAKLVFIYAARMAAKASGDNKVSQMTLKCGMCYIECLEKVTDYINESAYAYMAVSGENFVKSAWNGFLLNVKHIMKFSFANLIARVFIFLGKVGITVGNVFSLLFIMKTIVKVETSSIFGPCIVVGLFTYFTATVFLGLFDTAVLSMMTSLAIDMDMNGTPKFGPPTFHDSVKQIEKSQADNSYKRQS